ncbi:MAG: ABC transporter substrate-binding protein [Pseudomonadota bacterium]
MKRFLTLVAIGGLLAATSIQAALPDPASVVKATTEQVLERVIAERDELRSDANKMYNLVAEMIFPHFDFGIMSQWVLGTHWKDADEASREAFVDQFRKLLVKTYATALLEFSDQAISYPPAEDTGSGATATVVQEIATPGSSIPLIYRLHNKTGSWKVYDVSVDGVSLVKTYRASFSPLLNGDGLQALIDTLDQKNQE